MPRGVPLIVRSGEVADPTRVWTPSSVMSTTPAPNGVSSWMTRGSPSGGWPRRYREAANGNQWIRPSASGSGPSSCSTPHRPGLRRKLKELHGNDASGIDGGSLQVPVVGDSLDQRGCQPGLCPSWPAPCAVVDGSALASGFRQQVCHPRRVDGLVWALVEVASIWERSASRTLSRNLTK